MKIKKGRNEQRKETAIEGSDYDQSSFACIEMSLKSFNMYNLI
jgi:hypothetical protein